MRKHNEIRTLGAPRYKMHFPFLKKLWDFKSALWSEKYGKHKNFTRFAIFLISMLNNIFQFQRHCKNHPSSYHPDHSLSDFIWHYPRKVHAPNQTHVSAQYVDQWCSRDCNLRRPRPSSNFETETCPKSWDRDSRLHISLMVIKANFLKNATKIFGRLPNTKIKVFAVAMLQ